MIDLTTTEFIIPAHKEVYPFNFNKMSKRRRKPCNKNLGVLEYGNTAIVVELDYTEDLHTKLEDWWEIGYELFKVNWDVELFSYPQGGYIEIIIFEETPFYRADDFHLTSVQDEPEVYFHKGITIIPECFHDSIKSVRLEDWDYSTNKDRVGV